MFRSLSFGITISASTLSRSCSIPRLACLMRRRPSKVNGSVTTATTSAPVSFAIPAMTGAAPVPVPPPIPAAMKTMSAPSTTERSSSRDSIADLQPISGSDPAPSPFVSSLPRIMRHEASESSRCAMSVFAAMNSTPVTPPRMMWLSALLPAPPTPMTFMTSRAGKLDLSSCKKFRTLNP